MKRIKSIVIYALILNLLSLAGCCCCSKGFMKEASITQGDTYFSKDNYIEAVKSYDEALGMDPNNEGVKKKKMDAEKMVPIQQEGQKKAEIGDDYYKKGDYDRAIDYYDEALKVLPKNEDIQKKKNDLLAEIEEKNKEQAELENEKYEKISSASWNTSDTDATSNGNLSEAVSAISSLSSSDLRSRSESVSLSYIIKSPWKYYGHVISFSGQVSNIKEYPPGSQEAENIGGPFAEMSVYNEASGVSVDVIFMGDTGNIVQDSYVNLCALPIGMSEGQNAFGSSVDMLVVVGK